MPKGGSGTLRAIIQCRNATVLLPIRISVLCKNFYTFWLQKSASKSRAYSIKENKGESICNAQFSHLFLRLNNKFCFQKFLLFPYFRIVALIQSNKGKHHDKKSVNCSYTQILLLCIFFRLNTFLKLYKLKALFFNYNSKPANQYHICTHIYLNHQGKLSQYLDAFYIVYL